MGVRAVLAAVAMGLVAWHALGPSGSRARRLLRVALVATCLVGVGNYFGFEKRQLVGVHDYYDVTFYYLNSKYFDELGYLELYRAMLLADEQGAHRLDHIRTVRDLGDYQNRPRRELMRDSNALRTRFSAERWQAFVSDVDFLVQKRSRGQLDYFFKDHGYNATPTWTLLGSALSSVVEVRQLKWITSIDLLLLGVMFLVLQRTLGVEVMLFALLFFTCTHSGRWPVAGQALLRFDWLTALVTGYCALRSGRSTLGGALLAYAVQARLFPIVFVVPLGIGWLVWAWRERRVPPAVWQAALGGAATLALFAIGAALRYGPDCFADAAARLSMHAGPASYSSLRVGLADALVFRGERIWPVLGAAGGIPAKAELVASLLPLTRVVALLLCLLFAAHALRRRPEPATLVPLGGLLLFALFNPQINYFNSRILWVPWHLAAPAALGNVYGLCMLFLVEVVANAAHHAGAIDYAVTSLSSIGLLLHALGVVAVLWVQLRGDTESAPRPVPRTALRALAGLLASTAVLGAYWQAGERPAPRLTGASELASPRPEGSVWDAAGNHVLDAGGLRVTLNGMHHDRHVTLSHDQDDHYDVVFERDGERVASMRIGSRGRARRGTLVHTTLAAPRRAVSGGYDTLLLLPTEGDSRFSVGHLRLDD